MVANIGLIGDTSPIETAAGWPRCPPSSLSAVVPTRAALLQVLDKPRLCQLNLFPTMRIQPSHADSRTSRRHFLRSTATASLGAVAFGPAMHGQASALPPPLSTLKPQGSRVRPIA